MCLVKGKENDACIHPWCARAKKLPQYHVTRQSLIDANPDFKEFKRWKSDYTDNNWMMSINNTTGKSMTEIKTFGDWPIDRDVFTRSEVEVQFIEVLEDYSVFNEATKEIEFKKRLDVDEFYVYTGGLHDEKSKQEN